MASFYGSWPLAVLPGGAEGVSAGLICQATGNGEHQEVAGGREQGQVSVASRRSQAYRGTRGDTARTSSGAAAQWSSGQVRRGRRGWWDWVCVRFVDDSDGVDLPGVLADRCVDTLALDCVASAGPARRSITVATHSAAPAVSSHAWAAWARYTIASCSSPGP